MSGAVRPRGLDAASRRTLARFTLELCWFAAIAAGPAVMGHGSQAEAAASFGTYCSFAALIRVVISARRRERPGGPSLNGWDQCLGMTAAAMLGYAAARMLG
jgi:hypothetical protein